MFVAILAYCVFRCLLSWLLGKCLIASLIVGLVFCWFVWVFYGFSGLVIRVKLLCLFVLGTGFCINAYLLRLGWFALCELCLIVLLFVFFCVGVLCCVCVCFTNCFIVILIDLCIWRLLFVFWCCLRYFGLIVLLYGYCFCIYGFWLFWDFLICVYVVWFIVVIDLFAFVWLDAGIMLADWLLVVA